MHKVVGFVVVEMSGWAPCLLLCVRSHIFSRLDVRLLPEHLESIPPGKYKHRMQVPHVSSLRFGGGGCRLRCPDHTFLVGTKRTCEGRVSEFDSLQLMFCCGRGATVYPMVLLRRQPKTLRNRPIIQTNTSPHAIFP